MTKTELALLALVRSGLWETEPDMGDFPPMSPLEWECVWQMARQQTVSGIAYRGLVHLPTHLLPEDGLLFRWVAEADRIESLSRHHNECVCSLMAMFQAHGLNPILLKGQGTASMYEWPLLREAGDIDLYFSSALERTQAIDILKEKGINPTYAPDGSAGYVYKGVEVEHHAAYCALNAPQSKKYLRIMEVECGFAEGLLAGDRERAVMLPSPMLHLVLLNAHILHHAMGRGIGLRQLCDMARAYHTLMPLTDNYRLLMAYGKLHLLGWSRLLHSFLVQYMGLNPDRLPKSKSGLPKSKSAFSKAEGYVSSKPLLQIILRGANFGHHSAAGRRVSSAAKGTAAPSKGTASAANGEASAANNGLPSVFAHKAGTFGAFVRHLPFSLRFAPEEALFTMASLFKGQW